MHYWVRHASVGDRGAGRETRRLWNNPPNKYLLREGCHVLGTGYSSEQNERTAPPCGAQSLMRKTGNNYEEWVHFTVRP